MNKARILLLLMLGFITIGLHSCIDKDYNDLDNSVYFSQDGLAFPAGSIDTIYFVRDIHPENTPVEIGGELEYTLGELFEGGTIDKFFSERSPSDFRFSFEMDLNIKAPSNIELDIIPKVVTKNAQGELIDTDINLLNGADAIAIRQGKGNKVNLLIKGSDVDAMQKATGLRFYFKFKLYVEKFDEKDMFYIRDIVISKSGGIFIDL